MTVVAVLLDFDTLEGATAFADNPELVEVIKSSGVLGTRRATIAEVT